MKKRIGSKLYNTDTAICVLPEQHLYRAQKMQTYFRYDGETIIPVDYDEAVKMLSEGGGADGIMTGHKASHKGCTVINVSPGAADHLAAYSRKTGISMKKIIEDYIYSLSIE